MGLIEINYVNIEQAVIGLKLLQSDLEYEKYITTELINESRGKVVNSINEIYEELCEIAQLLKSMAIQTEKVLCNVSDAFAKAEETVTVTIERMGEDMDGRGTTGRR